MKADNHSTSSIPVSQPSVQPSTQSTAKKKADSKPISGLSPEKVITNTPKASEKSVTFKSLMSRLIKRNASEKASLPGNNEKLLFDRIVSRIKGSKKTRGQELNNSAPLESKPLNQRRIEFFHSTKQQIIRLINRVRGEPGKEQAEKMQEIFADLAGGAKFHLLDKGIGCSDDPKARIAAAIMVEAGLAKFDKRSTDTAKVIIFKRPENLEAQKIKVARLMEVLKRGVPGLQQPENAVTTQGRFNWVKAVTELPIDNRVDLLAADEVVQSGGGYRISKGFQELNRSVHGTMSTPAKTLWFWQNRFNHLARISQHSQGRALLQNTTETSGSQTLKSLMNKVDQGLNNIAIELNKNDQKQRAEKFSVNQSHFTQCLWYMEKLSDIAPISPDLKTEIRIAMEEFQAVFAPTPVEYSRGSSEEAKRKGNPAGFRNYGNTCFVNGALKPLLASLSMGDIQFLKEDNNETGSIKNLKSAFVELVASYHEQSEPGQTTENALKNLLEACRDCAQSGESDIFKGLFPKNPVKAIIPIKQQDASEFSGELVNLLKLNEQPEMSIICTNKRFTAMDAGKELSRSSEQYPVPQSFMYATMDVDDSHFQQCIDRCMEGELSGVNWDTDSGVKALTTRVRVEYAVDIDRFKTLNIYLNSFRYDPAKGAMVKDEALARKVLENSDEFLTIPVFDKNNKSLTPYTALLQLNGVTFHRGSSLHSGHYTAATNENGQWVSHNDSTVKAIPNLQHAGGTPYLLSFKVVDILPPQPNALVDTLEHEGQQNL